MRHYCIIFVSAQGEQKHEVLRSVDDDAAIACSLPLARGGLIEIWRQGKLVATIDERPYFVSRAA